MTVILHRRREPGRMGLYYFAEENGVERQVHFYRDVPKLLKEGAVWASDLKKKKDEDRQRPCQICGRVQMIVTNKDGVRVMAHHGYTRPGWGAINGTCLGSRYPAYTVSRERIAEVIPMVEASRDRQAKFIKFYEETPPQHFEEYFKTHQLFEGERTWHLTREEKRERGTWQVQYCLWRGASKESVAAYDAELASRIAMHTMNHRNAVDTIAYLKKRHKDWKQKEKA